MREIESRDLPLRRVAGFLSIVLFLACFSALFRVDNPTILFLVSNMVIDLLALLAFLLALSWDRLFEIEWKKLFRSKVLWDWNLLGAGALVVFVWMLGRDGVISFDVPSGVLSAELVAMLIASSLLFLHQK